MGSSVTLESTDAYDEPSDAFVCLIYGFVRQNTMMHNLEMPKDVVDVISKYNKSMDYQTITSFHPEFCDRKKWKLSNHNTYIKGVYSGTGDYYCVGFMDKNGNNAFDKG
eukprot:115763_1